ncbi:MAG: alpha/beta hydrolase [Microbacteriaceae bacterium]
MTVTSPFHDQLSRIPVRAASIELAGRVTRYWEYGDPGAAVTLVLVHGFRGDHHGLEPVVAQLPGLRMICPDLPGFGESEPLGGRHDLAGYAGWLRALITKLEIEKDFLLLGHSFGSIVVSAALAPDPIEPTDYPPRRPDRLILINPIAAPALQGPRGILTRLAVFYYWLASILPDRLGFALLRNRVIVRVMSMAMAKTRDRSLRGWIHDQHDRYFSAFSDRKVVLEAFRASVGADVSSFAAMITVPTLLIAAERDDITALPAQYRLAALFPDATLRVIAGVGHLIHYEAPEQAAQYIREFLASRPDPSARPGEPS